MEAKFSPCGARICYAAANGHSARAQANLGCLLLEKLVPHGEEGDGEPAAEEEDEVDGQLVPGPDEE